MIYVFFMKPRVTFSYQVFLDWAVFSREGTLTRQGTFKGKMMFQPYLKEYPELFRWRTS